jgi:uncharacterized protein YbjT (DUF2867 family)
MKILVTGANGFVGKSFCAELLNQGHEVRAAVRTKVVPIENVEVVKQRPKLSTNQRPIVSTFLSC